MPVDEGSEMAGNALGNAALMSLTAAQARKMVAQIAADSSRVFFSEHAEQRMSQRRVTRSQVMCCLRRGRVAEGPARGVKGNWELTMEVLSAGDWVRVVLALDNDGAGNYIVVITIIR